MHLYIIAGHIHIDISDVTLVDGHKPSVRGYQPVGIDFEPAVWFKVMVLDAVTIDCDKRRLSWIPLCDSTISDFAALDSGIALCGSYRSSDCSAGGSPLVASTDDSLYCQLDEAFDAIPHLLMRYERNQIMRDDFSEQLMKLLHVHVLPNIRLTALDADCVLACIHALEVIINQIDKDILEVAEKIELAEQSLANLRRKLLCGLMSHDKKGGFSCSSDFLDLLLSKKGIEKDIEVAWAAVEEAQVLVERLKEKVVQNDTEENDVALMRQRAERDVVTAEYEKLLAAREKLKEIRRSKRSLVKRVRDTLSAVHEDPQHKIYVGIIFKLTEFEKLNEIITHKKLLVTSVKEAARLALKDIQSGADSFGMEIDCFGAAHSTDVLGGNIKASWQSVAEQVAALLANRSHHIAKLHEQFCRHITDACSAAALEKQLNDESLQALQHSNSTSKLNAKPCIVTSTSSSSSPCVSEFQLDRIDSVSLPGDQTSSELVRSLPLPDTGSVRNGSGSMRSVSAYNPQTVDPDIATEVSSGSHKKRSVKSATLTPSFKSYIPRSFISLTPTNDGDDSPVVIVDINRDCVRIALESIRKEILDHFDRISRELQDELSVSVGKSHHQQIWLDYENHFYQKMMGPLTGLYQLQYASITDAFCSSLITLTPSDLSLDEAVLINLLQDQDEELICSANNCALKDSEDKHVQDAESKGLQAAASFDVGDEEQVADDVEGDDLSRLLRCHSQDRKRPRLRTVRISMPVISVPHSPTSVLVYERTLAPLPSERDLLQYKAQLSSSATSMILKPCYRQQFSSAVKHIESAIEARTPGTKLRYLTDCLRETARQLAVFYAKLYGNSPSQSSSDELLDAIVILLCNIDGRQMAVLYCQLSLLADMMAPWLIRGPYSFTLVQFTGACQFIQERLMLKRNRHLSKAVIDT